MAWTTTENVELWTGVAGVTDATIAVASSMIDTFTGADEELPEDTISAADKRHLAKATAWQAVWIAGKPGLFTQRENAVRVSSDSQTIEREDRADAMLAPMARREIMNLSWVGTRTTFVPPARVLPATTNFLNEASDPAWLGS